MNGKVDVHTGIYRNADDGPCQGCMHLDQDWEGRVVAETVVYNSRFEIA
jgi:hypothetical protein